MSVVGRSPLRLMIRRLLLPPYPSSFRAISTSSDVLLHRALRPYGGSVRHGGYGTTDPTTRRHSSSSSTAPPRSSSVSTTVSLSPSSLNVLPTIPPSLLRSIRQLPEVESALSSSPSSSTATSDAHKVLEDLDRARTIFKQFDLPDEYNAVASLYAQILHDEGRYEEAIETMESIRDQIDVGSKEGEGKEEERTLQDVWKLSTRLAKSHWYRGDFETAEEVADGAYGLFRRIEMERDEEVSGAEATTGVGLRMGCSMNALALSKLALLDMADQRVRGLRREGEGEGEGDKHEEDRSWGNTLRKADMIEDMLGMASRVLVEDYRTSKDAASSTSPAAVRLALAGAASLCNRGVAKLLYLAAKRRLMGTTNAMSTDSAAFVWTEALVLLDDLHSYLDADPSSDGDDAAGREHLHFISTAKAIRARVHCNMAWTILFFDAPSSPPSAEDGGGGGEAPKPTPLTEEKLNAASDHAGRALKLYEDLSLRHGPSVVEPCLGRALGLVASCYARAGSSVTAEGLFQSAVDKCDRGDGDGGGGGGGEGIGGSGVGSGGSPLTKLDLRSCYLAYSDLCRAWEKREVDAQRNEEKALDVDRGLGDDTDSSRRRGGVGRNGWEGKSGIYSGLWFFTIGDF